MSNVDKILREMREKGKIDFKVKGSRGEDAALEIVKQFYNKVGGEIYTSFKYPYQQNRQGVTYTGNIKYEDGKYVEYTNTETREFIDEIDILYISPYRIFPIEVKSYHAKMEVFDHWMKKNGSMVDKSPITQAEKHARHLYHALHTVLPEGRSEYIIPIVCFVDRCTVSDTRNKPEYIPCCVLNGLKKTLADYNIPLKYNISMKDVKRKLNEVKC